MVQGKDIILSVDGKAIAAAQSCDLDIDRDMIEVCSPVEGQWKRYIPTKIGWSASVSMLVVDMANPQAWLNEMKSSQTPLTMRYYDSELGMYQVGEVWIKSWKTGASVGSLATFNLSLQGNGALRDAEWESVTLNGELEGAEIYCTSGQVFIQRKANESIMHKVMTFTAPTKVQLDAPYGTCMVVKRGADIPEPEENPINITSQVAMHAHQPATPRVVEAVLPAGTYVFMSDKTDIQKTTPPTAKYME